MADPKYQQKQAPGGKPAAPQPQPQPAPSREEPKAKADNWPEQVTTEPPARETREQEARDSIWRLKLAVEAMRADVQRVLDGPFAREFRVATALEKCEMGGDASSWAPLNSVLKVIDRLRPLGIEPAEPVS